MKIKIAIALIAAVAAYATGPARESEIAGVWRARIVRSGVEVMATIDLQKSGDAILTATATPLDPTLFVAGPATPYGRPERSLNFEARGKWNVRFNGLRTKFEEANPHCGLDLDKLYGGKIVSVEPKQLVLRPRSERGEPPTETWNR